MKYIDLTARKEAGEIVIDKPGEYIATMRNVSGEYVFRLACEKIDLKIIGLFDGRSSDDFRIHTVQHHAAPNSVSNLLIKGVFRDASKFHYTGMVKIDKGAQGSHAYQKNQNLLLSKDAFVESEPFLEIEANDVFCTHGSTTGRINEDEVFYLKTRGIDAEHAKTLIVDGFLREVSEKFPQHHS